MNILGAIFDLDGTILDSMGIWASIASRYLRSLGIQPRADVDDVVKTLSMEDAARYFIREYHVSRSVPEIVQEVCGMIETFYRETVPLKPGAAQLLAWLQQKGVQICAATSGDKTLAEAALSRCGVLPYFKRIFTCAEVGHGKEEPIIYETARAFLGTQTAETVVFEDTLYALQTAKAAGFPTAAVADPSSEQDREAIRLCADVYLHTLMDWVRIYG